ncbi:CLUMA_CG018259, isoform A [Clunio marinus]|uniref:CLUMA_CG018259, isoform A n=1 Tax=Clunio marinus TaxID=568069 RepID=A0A1J1J160_9DIPT|nr:CLUMA_CG018259, isoform A [Clunio marinus]
MNNYNIFFCFALIALCSAGVVPTGYHVQHQHYPTAHGEGQVYHQSAPIVLQTVQHLSSSGGGLAGGYENNGGEHNDYYHHPSYKFEYGVKDSKTGDHKSQWEHRDGDVVKGEYTLDEADGTKRVVKYHADDKSGFNAVEEKIGHAHHPQHYEHHGHQF